MPRDLIHKFRLLLLFHRTCLDGEIDVKLPAPLQNLFHNNRGKRSLPTTGVNLQNPHQMEEKVTGLPALQGRLMVSLWECGSSLTG